MAEAEYVDRIRGFIRRHPWTFAKTMPEHPHEYVVRQRCRDDAAFDHFVETIRKWGASRRWGGRTYIYLRVDGHEYWTMGAPVAETTIINRAVVAQEQSE